jgi:hypothetical protein
MNLKEWFKSMKCRLEGGRLDWLIHQLVKKSHHPLLVYWCVEGQRFPMEPLGEKVFVKCMVVGIGNSTFTHPPPKAKNHRSSNGHVVVAPWCIIYN